MSRSRPSALAHRAAQTAVHKAALDVEAALATAVQEVGAATGGNGVKSANGALASDVSFSSLGEAVFSWQCPDSGASIEGRHGPAESRRISMESVPERVSLLSDQASFDVPSSMPAACSMESSAALPLPGTQACAEHLEQIKIRCAELMQKMQQVQSAKVRDSTPPKYSPMKPSPKKRTSMGGA
jgi:hypothetical protein